MTVEFMSEDPNDPPFERLRAKGKTFASKSTLEAVDAHYDGGLTKWKKRNAKALQLHSANEGHFDIAVSELFAKAKGGDQAAFGFLDKVIDCAANNKCWQVFCPACRARKQALAVAKAKDKFSGFNDDEIFMMTVLIEVVPDATDIRSVVDTFRGEMHERLRNNAAGLGKPHIKIIGLFEVDLVNLGTHYNLKPKNRSLMKKLGFNPTKTKSQFFVHLHAIVAPLDDKRRSTLENIVADALGQAQLEPNQVHFKRLHSGKSKDENLKEIASYMNKARTQFSDVYETATMEMKKKYHTPYTGEYLVDFLQAMAHVGQFKGLKFDYGISRRRQ